MRDATTGTRRAAQLSAWALLLGLIGCGEDLGRVEDSLGPGLDPGTGTSGDEVDSSDDDGASDDDDGSGDGDHDEPPDDDGPMELCDGFDNDADGQVDELCACEIGEAQDCFAGPPGATLECRRTTQVCQGSGSESGGLWGACAGLCDDSTLTLDDDAMFRVWGQDAGDRFSLVSGGSFGDIDGDGEIDLLGASLRGDGASADVGAAYPLFGGGCLQGQILDLATMPLGGSAEEGLGGFVVDNATAFDNEGSPAVPNALLTDANGDGLADVLATHSGRVLGLAFGSAAPSPLVSFAEADGGIAARLTGGGGSWKSRWGLGAADYDADGYADLFMPSFNASPTCPCADDGVSVWWGDAAFPAERGRDAMIKIGIGTVGEASQSNHSVVGGYGDFNGDGTLDITAGNGGANDGHQIDHRSFAFFGQADRSVPGTMTGTDGSDGFALGGGSGRGPYPNHQHGDFNGDGLDDFIAFAHAGHGQVYVVYGRHGSFPASLVANALGTDGVMVQPVAGGPMLAPSIHMGVGDIDADGYDELVVETVGEWGAGLAILWGRSGATGTLELVEEEITWIEGTPELGGGLRIAVEDVDGDGLGDVIVGAPNATTPNGAQSGAGLVKFGSCLAALHNPGLLRGYDGTETITASPGSETIASGRGNDTVTDIGEFDVVYGGAGDDRFVVTTPGFARIDGGVGTDTVVLEGPMTLDLRQRGRMALRDVERISLADGAQTLALNAGDVTALSRTSSRLEVDGDAGDSVILGGDWFEAGAAGEHVEYRRGALVVAVSAAVDVSVVP